MEAQVQEITIKAVIKVLEMYDTYQGGYLQYRPVSWGRQDVADIVTELKKYSFRECTLFIWLKPNV